MENPTPNNNEQNGILNSKNIIPNSTFGNIGGYFRVGDDNTNINLFEVDNKKLKERKDTINLLKNIYEERFSKKMNKENNLRIEIENSYTKIGTDSEQRKYVLSNYVEGTLRNETELIQDFLEKYRRLTIIGEKGSGKSLLLLKFALELTKKALEDDSYPIPIVLDLSNYRNNKTFEEWLKENIKTQTRHGDKLKKSINKLVEDKNIILLLDGLDEVSNLEIEHCIKNINEYIKKDENSNFLPTKIIICCCEKYYRKLPIKLSVKAITKIVPLDIEKIVELLSKKNITASNILVSHIKKHKKYLLKNKLLISPFEINIALSIAEDYLTNDFIPSKLETDNLINIYINQQIEKNTYYQTDKVKNYLSYTAKKLKDENKGVAFDLMDIQINWINNIRLYRIIIFCTVMILWKITSYIASDFFMGGFIIASTISSKNTINDKILGFNVKKINTNRLIIGSLFGSCLALPIIIIGYFFSFDRAILLGITAFMIGLIFFSFGKIEKIDSKTPYSIFLREIYYLMFFFFPLVFTFFMFFDYIIIDLPINFSPLLKILLQSFFAALIGCFIISNLILHILVRIFLYFENKIPFNYVSFLNDDSLKGILYYEKNTGKWRFRHQLIQDRLAEKK